ncbi:MAG TPA: hypothetical protein VKU00_15900 [Chthonomonadaceae bacterium]|nr:hypothetical protein [Chthonomonadaceae bacterium]
MQIHTWLILGVVLVLAFSGALFLVGYTAGRLGRKWIGVILFVVMETVILMGTGVSLIAKIGLLALEETALITVAINCGVICGYVVGIGQKSGKPRPALIAILLVLLVADVLGFYLVNKRLADVAQETNWFNESTPQPQSTPEASNSQDPAENLKALYRVMAQYADSNEGNLPPAANWMDNDDLKGYIQHDEWLHDPEVSSGRDAKFGYAYNDAVAGHKLKAIPDAAKTPLLYESTNTGKSAHDAVTSLPKPGRRNGKNAILYCDGHVEMK